MTGAILHRGLQWLIQDDCIIAPNEGGYWIGRESLLERGFGDRDKYLGWVIHLAEKEWVHLSDLEAATRVAFGLWAPNESTSIVGLSFAKARRMRELDGYQPDPPPRYPLDQLRPTSRGRRRQR